MTSRVRAFSFEADGACLRGHWHRPTHPSRRGVVMFHGAGGYSIGPRRLFVEFGDLAAEAGWETLRFDFRGRGHSDPGSSTGGTNAEVSDWVDDAVIACREFRAAAQLESIAVLGLCAGATIALAAAPGATADLVILWSPELGSAGGLDRIALGHRQLRHRLLGYGKKLFRAETWERLRLGQIDLRSVCQTLIAPFRGGATRPHDVRALHGSASKELRARRRDGGPSPPILIVAASSDPEAEPTVSYCSGLLDQAKRSYRVVWIRGADHNFFSRGSRKSLYASTLQFLDRPDQPDAQSPLTRTVRTLS